MGQRADNKDGSCRQVQTGRHAGKWRVQYTQMLETGKKQRLSRLFDTKTDAKDFLHDLRHGAKVEAKKRGQELTLGGWLDWLAENDWPESLVELTITSRKRRFAKYVQRHLGGVPLSKIDPLTVRTFYKHLRDEGVSEHTLIAIRSDLVRIFNQAISPYRRVPVTMANPFRLPLQRPQKRIAIALTPDEAVRALNSRKLDVSRRAMLGLFLMAGVRLGEMMAMTREQLRFDDDLIVIDRAVRVAFGGKQSVEMPKGKKTRLAVMSRSLKTLLLAHAAEMDPGDFLWPAASGNQPRMKKLVYATWRTILNDAKLPAEMSPHDCRLSHINWIEKLMPEVSPMTLKEHVGHAAMGVTEANYTRPIAPAQQILRDCLERTIMLRSMQ